MSKKIKTDDGNVEFEVCHLGVNVTDHHEQEAIWARLSDAQRVELADALAPGRPAGGQWTRDDLPVASHAADGMAGTLTYGMVEGILEAVASHLNKYHPKPGIDATLARERDDLSERVHRQAASIATLQGDFLRVERERDESLRKKGEMVDRAVRAENARDTAATRAEQLEREVSKVEGRASEWSIKAQEWQDRAEAAEKRHQWPKTTPTGHTYIAPDTYAALCHQHGNAAQAAIESWDADECPPEPTWEMVGIAHREVERLQRERDEWKARATLEEQERENWRITAINRATPAVSRAEIEEQLRIAYESGNHPIQRIRIATDAVCDLFGVEAEQAVDPVEAKARELWEASRDTDNDPAWQELLEMVDDTTIEFSMDRAFAYDDVERMRRLARHVLGQEATR